MKGKIVYEHPTKRTYRDNDGDARGLLVKYVVGDYTVTVEEDFTFHTLKVNGEIVCSQPNLDGLVGNGFNMALQAVIKTLDHVTDL